MKHRNEKLLLAEYLHHAPVSIWMAAYALKIERANCTRYKAQLEKQGVLRVVKIAPCQISGEHVQYVTTNAEFFPADNQLKLDLI